MISPRNQIKPRHLRLTESLNRKQPGSDGDATASPSQMDIILIIMHLIIAAGGGMSGFLFLEVLRVLPGTKHTDKTWGRPLLVQSSNKHDKVEERFGSGSFLWAELDRHAQCD